MTGLRRREHGTSDERPLLTRTDIAVAAWLIVLLPIAWLLPQQLWSPACVRVSRVVARLARRSTAGRVERTRGRIGAHAGLPAPEVTVLSSMAGRMERNLQYLREHRPGGWHPRIELTGAEHVDRTLEDRRGCILWMAPLLSANLVAKKGLHAAGYEVTHLSHEWHGGSNSRLGHRLNAVRTRPEARYLAERLVMTEGTELKRTRDLYDRLQANALVSITAETIWGARMVTSPFLGGELRLPTGAPSLSLATGAALLPTFTLKHTSDRFEVIIEPALKADDTGDRHAAVDDLARQYTRRVEHHVRRHPEQYSEWW